MLGENRKLVDAQHRLMNAPGTVASGSPADGRARRLRRPPDVGSHMRARLLSGLTLWLLLVAGSLGWNLYQAEQARQSLARETARAFFEHLVLTRRWNARHGGVYVPETKDTQPNPYLDDPLRDIRVNDKLTLTKINPAYMTRQLGELAIEGSGIQFHITSLNPLRPANAALPWEAEALRAFETGTDEVGFVVRFGEHRGYRYMAPLMTEKPCLACHGEQGCRPGDVRGGISVTLPRLAPLPVATLVSTHLGIGIAGVVFILGFGRALTRAYDRLRHQAVFDALTAIPNRRFFTEQLVHEMQQGRRKHEPLSLVICDLDHFKSYNDTYGHLAGDRALQAVAQVLQDTLRRGSDFCARYGGEEFVVVLPDTPLAGAVRLAERAQVAVAGLGIRHKGSPKGIVTVSFGVAGDADGLAPEELIRRADDALYRAKALGRNRVAVHEAATAAVAEGNPARRDAPKLSVVKDCQGP